MASANPMPNIAMKEVVDMLLPMASAVVAIGCIMYPFYYVIIAAGHPLLVVVSRKMV